MDTKDKEKVNTKINDILNCYTCELSDDITRDKIGYELKCFLLLKL